MSTEKLSERCSAPSVGWRSKNQSLLSDFFGNSFACLIPMLIFIEVDLVGRLFLSEILLLCMLPFLLWARGHLLLAPLPRKLILLGFAWLLAQIITDAIRGTPLEDLSRGWAKITFLLLNFSAVYLYLNGRKNRFFWFAAGIALGQILAYFLNPNIFVENYPWKFGYGTAITLLAVLFTQIRIFENNKFLPSIIILGMGVLNFYLDFRSLGLICVLTGGFLLIRKSDRFGSKKLKRSDVVLLILLGSVALYGITKLYDYTANAGWLGMEVRDKYLLQSSGDMGILLGGRSEILASGQAIIDSPLIGHGSWAKDQKYADILMYALNQHGYEIQGGDGSDLIPSHSYIMGAWVEAGLVGAIFWFFGIILTVRCLIAIYIANATLAPLVTFIAFNLLWNIAFSPFGAETRLYAAYDLSLIIVALTLSKYSITTKRRT
jgi:O-antigen ligase